MTIILEPLNVLVDHPKQLVVHVRARGRKSSRPSARLNVKMLFDVYHQQISEGNLSGNIRAYQRPDRLLPDRRPPRPATSPPPARSTTPTSSAPSTRRRLPRPHRPRDEPQGRPARRLQGPARGRRRRSRPRLISWAFSAFRHVKEPSNRAAGSAIQPASLARSRSFYQNFGITIFSPFFMSRFVGAGGPPSSSWPRSAASGRAGRSPWMALSQAWTRWGWEPPWPPPWVKERCCSSSRAINALGREFLDRLRAASLSVVGHLEPAGDLGFGQAPRVDDGLLVLDLLPFEALPCRRRRRSFLGTGGRRLEEAARDLGGQDVGVFHLERGRLDRERAAVLRG